MLCINSITGLPIIMNGCITSIRGPAGCFGVINRPSEDMHQTLQGRGLVTLHKGIIPMNTHFSYRQLKYPVVMWTMMTDLTGCPTWRPYTGTPVATHVWGDIIKMDMVCCVPWTERHTCLTVMGNIIHDHNVTSIHQSYINK